MSKQTENYEALAAAAGLRYDLVNNMLYGQKNGYDFLVYATDSRYPYVLTVHTSAKGTIVPTLSKNDIKEFEKSLKPVLKMQQTGNNIAVSMRGTGNQEKLRQWLSETINALLSFLQAKSYTPCCSNCGQSVEEISGYRAGGQYMHLCPNCEGTVRGNFQTEEYKKQSKKENLVGGIVGALLGSLIGVVCIIALSQLGYVAALSGVVMAVGVLKGYELLGGKLTKRGVVIGVIIMLIMTYVGDRIDWGISLAREVPSLTAFEWYRMIPQLLAEDMIDKTVYFGNLVLLYLFLLLGAVPTIKSRVTEEDQQYTLVKVGSTGSFNNFIQ